MSTAERLKVLEAEGPRRFSRWSPALWRAVVSGPGARLAAALGTGPHAARTLENWLLLAREAVGLQLVTLDDVARLDPAHEEVQSVSPGFLAVALLETLPRLLPAASPEVGARALATFWNAGERLARDRSWVDRYLAARLEGLDTLEDAGPMLAHLVAEAADDGKPCTWNRIARWTQVDPVELDGAFLPGDVTMLAPRVALVADRRRPGRALGLLLRPVAAGGPVWLGPIAAQGGEASVALAGADVSSRVEAALAGEGVQRVTALRSGFAIVTLRLSQRVRVAEGA